MAAVTPNDSGDTDVEVMGEHVPGGSPTPRGERLPFDSTQLQAVDEGEVLAARHSSTVRTPLGPGAQLGDYVLEELIEQGGMGDVYSAVHPLIGKRAAIKLLKKSLCEDPLMVERFIGEARVVNQIGHPNIVDVFAFGETSDGRSYLAMEWLNGESLRDAIAWGPLEVGEACRITRQLARALEAAHEKGVIHRDLKPDNVCLVEVRGEPPRVKLLDFGIAKLVDSSQRLQQTAKGTLVGTPQYMAPEQARAQPIDGRVDIYALGCLAFELLTGATPFVARNSADMLALHVKAAPPRLADRANVPAELDDLVARMLAKRPDDRPSLAEVEAVLGRIEDGRRTNAMTATMPAAVRAHEAVVEYVVPDLLAPNRAPEPSSSQSLRRQPSLIEQAPPWSIAAIVTIVVLIAASLGFLLVRILVG